MIPDPASGGLLRAFALLAYAACSLLALADLTGCDAAAPRTCRSVSVGSAGTEPCRAAFARVSAARG